MRTLAMLLVLNFLSSAVAQPPKSPPQAPAPRTGAPLAKPAPGPQAAHSTPAAATTGTSPEKTEASSGQSGKAPEASASVPGSDTDASSPPPSFESMRSRFSGPTSLEEVARIRDPFRKLEVVRGRQVVPKTELELFPIEEFKMIGVMDGPERVRAMISAPNGKTYFVKENDRIGTRGGQVRRITSKAVIVKEKVIDPLGKEEIVNSEILLPVGN